MCIKRDPLCYLTIIAVAQHARSHERKYISDVAKPLKSISHFRRCSTDAGINGHHLMRVVKVLQGFQEEKRREVRGGGQRREEKEGGVRNADVTSRLTTVRLPPTSQASSGGVKSLLGVSSTHRKKTTSGWQRGHGRRCSDR